MAQPERRRPAGQEDNGTAVAANGEVAAVGPRRGLQGQQQQQQPQQQQQQSFRQTVMQMFTRAMLAYAVMTFFSGGACLHIRM